jgi:hypothetical protein
MPYPLYTQHNTELHMHYFVICATCILIILIICHYEAIHSVAIYIYFHVLIFFPWRPTVYVSFRSFVCNTGRSVDGQLLSVLVNPVKMVRPLFAFFLLVLNLALSNTFLLFATEAGGQWFVSVLIGQNF